DKRMPYLAMNTIYELGDLFMDELPLWHTTTYYEFKNLKRNYRLIFEDDYNDVRIYAVPNRYKFNFNFNITVQTEVAAWNVLTYINQHFENGGRNYANGIRIPAEIPNVFIHNIAKRMRFDLNTKEGQQDMRDYLMTHSLGPIEGMTNPATGNTSYKFNYSTNILLSYPDLANYDKEMRNLIAEKSSVRYAMSAELWTPASFILEIKGNKENNIKDVTNLSNDNFNFTLAVEQAVIPKQLDNGLQYIIRLNYQTSVNNEIEKKIKRIINSARKYKADLNKIIQVKLFKDNIEVQDRNYKVDYEDLEIELINPVSNTVFTLVVYADLKIMNMIDDMINNGKKN